MRCAVAFLVAFLVCGAAGGCGTDNHYADPEIKSLNPAETSLIVEPLHAAVNVVAVDGKHIGMGSRMRGRQFRIRPGIHHVVVTYYTGMRVSVHDAEVSFATEPGHRYQLQKWPPKVRDLTTKRWVPHQMRVAD